MYVCEQIIKNDKAYVVEGDVYFSVDNFPEYLSLSGRILDHNRAGSRVAVDTRKRNPADFALWKVSLITGGAPPSPKSSNVYLGIVCETATASACLLLLLVANQAQRSKEKEASPPRFSSLPYILRHFSAFGGWWLYLFIGCVTDRAC